MLALNSVIQDIKMHHILYDNPLEPLFSTLKFFIFVIISKFLIILSRSISQILSDKSHKMVMISLQIL